jgi:hypothetical protein
MRRFNMLVLVIYLAGLVGALVGWFLARLLVPEASWVMGGGVLYILAACCGFTIGLIAGLGFARWWYRE